MYLFKWLKPHLGEQRLRDFGTVEAERLLNDFADEKLRANANLVTRRAVPNEGRLDRLCLAQL